MPTSNPSLPVEGPPLRLRWQGLAMCLDLKPVRYAGEIVKTVAQS